MSTSQQILDDINLRYRNTFTVDQKLVWMNETQRELFEIIELDSVPFSFSTVAANYLYPIPDGVEKDRIKVMTIQINGNDDFVEIPFIENDNRQYGPYASYWYTILEDNFYLNVPGGVIGDRLVYIYLDQEPETINTNRLGVDPAVPQRFQEMLKLGVLKRIAAARKDIDMYNNYAADYEAKVADYEFSMKMSEPEFRQPIDMLPRQHRSRRSNYDYRYFQN